MIVAITGASGAIYAQMLVQELCRLKDRVAQIILIASKYGERVFAYELGADAWTALQSLPVVRYDDDNLFAPCASGAAACDAMFVTPCSMGALARIAHGSADTLIARSADVMLKERRRLIALVREMPYSAIHLANMQTLTAAGGIVCPASPAFYARPASLAEAAQSVTNRLLQLAGLQTDMGYSAIQE